MNINIQVIPHDSQRYETVGDWYYDANGDLQIRVSKMSDTRYEILVAIHEIVECVLCKHDGIIQEDVDVFDAGYEAAREEGDNSEPGDSPYAPYARQHCIATGLERIIAALLGVSWFEYDEEVNSLCKTSQS